MHDKFQIYANDGNIYFIFSWNIVAKWQAENTDTNKIVKQLEWSDKRSFTEGLTRLAKEEKSSVPREIENF